MAYHNVVHSSTRMRSKFSLCANKQRVLSLIIVIGLFVEFSNLHF